MSHDVYLSLVHLMVGVGSPTELQGRRTSFIHGVVTVPPKDKILAGTAHIKKIKSDSSDTQMIYRPNETLRLSDIQLLIDQPSGQRPLLTAEGIKL